MSLHHLSSAEGRRGVPGKPSLSPAVRRRHHPPRSMLHYLGVGARGRSPAEAARNRPLPGKSIRTPRLPDAPSRVPGSATRSATPLHSDRPLQNETPSIRYSPIPAAWPGVLAIGAGRAVGAMLGAARRLTTAGALIAADRVRRSLLDPTEQVYRIMAAVDIERFGNPSLDDWIRVQMRRALHRAVGRALAGAGVPGGRWSASSTGDGLLLLVEPTVQTARVLRALLIGLPRLLVDHNRSLPPLGRLRLRVVLHAAHIMVDEHGPSGEQVNLLFRILDADELRSRLAQVHAPFVLAVSDDVFSQVVRHRAMELDPDEFHPVSVAVKETRARAWIHADGVPSAPSRIEPPASASPVSVSPPAEGANVRILGRLPAA